MSIFRLTKLAKQDLLSIGRYTQVTWGREQRNRYLAKIDAAFSSKLVLSSTMMLMDRIE